MSRLDQLKQEVDKLYLSKNPDCADWADWLYQHHVFLVADYAAELSSKLGVNNDLPIAAAMLHDIADAIVKREDPRHEDTTLEIARGLLVQAGYNSEEIKIIVDDALRFHGCHNNERPKTVEGKVLATADAAVHLNSDFYDFAVKEKSKVESREQVSKWALTKIERDFNDKIAFANVREELRKRYEELKNNILLKYGKISL